MISMKKIIVFVFCLFATTLLKAEIYTNDDYNFSVDIPQCMSIEKIREDKKVGSALFAVMKDNEAVITIMSIRQEGMYKVSYNEYRKFLISQGNIILEEKPFYDLVRYEIAYVSSDNYYEKTFMKANSYITIGADFPLSLDAKQLISTFDNHRTWRSDWWRFHSNCPWYVRFLFFTLIVLFGLLSRGRKYSWVFVCLSVLMFAAEFVCLWHSKAVLAIVFSVTFVVWLVMLSQNKKLMWLVDSIFGN